MLPFESAPMEIAPAIFRDLTSRPSISALGSVALLAVSSPDCVTRNGASDGVLDPAYSAGFVPPVSRPTVVSPVPAVRLVDPINQPPI